MSRRIIYIGNDLAARSKYHSMMETLSQHLKDEGYDVIKSSAKKNIVLRLLDMIITVVKYRKADYVLIDTFSTLNFYYALIISQISRLLGIKYIPILHGGNLPNRLKNNAYYSKLIFRYSHLNIAPSNYLKRAFEAHNFNVTFIPNIIPISDYVYKERETLTPNLLWVRAFHTTYNPVLAIQVLKLLKDTYPEAKLCMIGPQKDHSYQETLDLISVLNLQDSVEITGVLPKEEWHKKSEEYAILINTTNVDNTPVSLIESMALGLPIVSTDVGGVPFLIENKKEGYLVTKNDSAKMASTIVQLLEAKTSHIEITKNARKKATSFDWSEVKNKWMEILK